MRWLGAAATVAALLLVTSCSSNDNKPAASGSTTAPTSTTTLYNSVTTDKSSSATSSTVASTTSVAPAATTTSAPVPACTATDNDLAKKLIAYAKAQQPTAPTTVQNITHATSDSTWASAAVVPDASTHLDGFIAIAHCVGSQWVVVDSGTSGVGCLPPVPAQISKEIGLEC